MDRENSRPTWVRFENYRFLNLDQATEIQILGSPQGRGAKVFFGSKVYEFPGNDKWSAMGVAAIVDYVQSREVRAAEMDVELPADTGGVQNWEGEGRPFLDHP